MVVIIAIAGLAIDLGNVERVRAEMQNAADAAATSGASTLLDFQSNVPVAEDTARRYGMAADGVNQITGVDTSTVSQTVSVECNVEYSGCGSATPNTVAVHETASVPTYFLSIFGITSIDVSTEAEACAPCQSSPHDIMLVLDHTGSMAAAGKYSSNTSVRKIDNLKAAVLQGFLTTLDPTYDHVGLVVFPPDTASAPACTPKNNVDNYRDYLDPTANYLEARLSNGYVDSNGTPNPSSQLIQDIGCLMPYSRTDYADPLEVAQSELDADGRPGVPKIILLISDGAANQLDDPVCPVTTTPIWSCMHPCQVGINVANTIKNAGTEIYAIVYSDLEWDNECSPVDGYHAGWPDDTMDGYTAMQQIASPGDYLEDPDPMNLKHILHQVSGELTGATTSRLVK